MNTVVLDPDGPLLDGRLRHYACYCEILTQHGFAVLPLDQYWEMKRARKNRREQLAATGADSLYGVFLTRWSERIQQPDLLKLDRLQPGVLSVLDAWSARGARMILATMRRDKHGLDAQLRQCELAHRFSSVLRCDHARGGVGKRIGSCKRSPVSTHTGVSGSAIPKQTCTPPARWAMRYGSSPLVSETRPTSEV